MAAGCGGDDDGAQPDAGDVNPADAADLGCQPVDDGNDCTQDLCDGDSPVYIDVAAGTACATGVCDGAGACVDCVADDDCAPDACNQVSHTCFTPQVGLVANADG
ncbi:MAG TPA: hypothetical protein VL172_01945, partial [Kofleriaceae bacterium]|nr:hypothetical protein [Kofleriaceae bacterium]